MIRYCNRIQYNKSIINSYTLINRKVLLRCYSTIYKEKDARIIGLDKEKSKWMHAEKKEKETKIEEVVDFKDLKITDQLNSNLKLHFNIDKPTIMQHHLLQYLNTDKEIILKGMTGSGKTFVTLLFLTNQIIKKQKEGLNTLFIVPNKELAIQIYNWYTKLLPNNHDLQVVYKDKNSEQDQDDLLNKVEPKVLLGTPSRILELMQQRKIKTNNINRIILDEVDHLLRLPTKYAPEKKKWNRDKHPKPTSIILDQLILTNDIKLLVMSATLNRSIRYYLNQQNYMKLPVYIDLNPNTANTIPDNLEHMCLIVNNHRVYNLNLNNQDKLNLKDVELQPVHSPNIDDKLLLESVAMCFHLDKVEKGILFLPYNISIENTIQQLNKMHINCKLLENNNIQNNDESVLYVTNYFNARGIDIPTLKHVFIIGYPESIQNYQHMCGRLNRFNNIDGRVITIIKQDYRIENKIKLLFNLLNIQLLDHPNLIE